MSKTILYPLKFHPILIEKIWGGEKLASLYGKKSDKTIGESWEISGVNNHVSIVSNGSLAHRSLTELVANFKEDFLGKKVWKAFGATFPLLFKFIDAQQDLSVQLHPNDAIAKKRHNSFGKTEMWHIMETEPNARLILGFTREITEKEFSSSLSSGTLLNILHEEPVSPGDTYFITPGTVHAIGAGIVLAEIQQTSDITYRIYDWDRPDVDGRMRELHNDLAIDVIDYSPSKAKITASNSSTSKETLCSTSYFETNKWELSTASARNLSHIDSFVVYMCIDGTVDITGNGHRETLTKGETLLIPACFQEIILETSKATLLEVYIPLKG